MNNTIKFLVTKNYDGYRLDVYLSKKIKDLTRSYIKKLIEKKEIKINKISIAMPSTKVRTNDEILVNRIKLKEQLLLLYQKFKNNDLTSNSNGVEPYHRRNLTKQLATVIKRTLS